MDPKSLQNTERNGDSWAGNSSKRLKLDQEIDTSTNVNEECDSDRKFSWDNELFEILNRKEGKYKIISEQIRIDELKICLQEGGCVLAKDAKKNTLLHIAVEKGFSEVIHFLLKKNINLLNIENGTQETPITIARKLQKNEIIKILEEWGATEKIPIHTASQPTCNQYDQINSIDISVTGNRTSVAPTSDPFPTIGDGNCFFHAVFGERNSRGVYEAKLANEMRQDYRKFLGQYVSLKDEHMPIELRDQLKKIFSLFLYIPEYLTDRLHNIKYIVAMTKEAIKYCEKQVTELKEIIADAFLQDELFRKDILEVLFSSKDSNIVNIERDLYSDRTKLINEISNCLEDCALKLYPNLTRSEFKKKYNSETVADSFLEGHEIFENYLNAVTSNRYYIFFEEVPIFASLGNVSITILYQLNGKHCSETFEPNVNLLGNFVPDSAVWGEKKTAVIHHQGLHFSYRGKSVSDNMQINAIDSEISSDGSIVLLKNTEHNLVSKESEELFTSSKHKKLDLILSPSFTALKIDSDLKYKKFKEFIVVPTDNSKNLTLNEIDTEVFPSPCVLIQLSELVYIDKEGKSDEEYADDLNLPSGWKLLITATNTKNGYFGAAFWNSKFRQLVVAHQGSKIFKDVCTDIHGIVLGEYVDQMNSAVTFADQVMCIAQDVLGSGWQLVFTGFSLGGWLAQVTCFCTEFLRRDGDHFIKRDGCGRHAHCVTFDSLGCDAMLRKLTKDFDLRFNAPYALDISTFLSAPNRINTFNLHIGTLYRIFPNFSVLNGSQKNEMVDTSSTHNIQIISNVFVKRIGKIQIKKLFKVHEVVDWPFTGFLGKREEFEKVFEWFDNLKGVHPHFCVKQLTIDEQMCLRYKTKAIDDKCCSLSVFSSNELLLLECLTSMDRENNILPKIEEFAKKNVFGTYQNLFPKFNIDMEKKKLCCETKNTLETLINRTKQLMCRFSSNLIQAVKDQLMDLQSSIDSVYIVETKKVLESISRHEIHFEDCFELNTFIKSEVERLMCITTDDVDFDVVRIHDICEKIQKDNTPNSQTFNKKFVKNESIIVLYWQQILNLNTFIDNHGHLLRKSNICDLVIIAFPSHVELKEETENALKYLLTSVSEKDAKKLIFVTSKQNALIRHIKNSCSEENIRLSIKHAKPICFLDVTPESRSKILNRPLLDIQDTHFKLGELFNVHENCSDSTNHLQETLDSNFLKSLIAADRLEANVKNLSMELYEEVTYAKIGNVASIENAVYFILNVESALKNVSKPIIFFIGIDLEKCNDAEKFSKHLNIMEEEQIEKIKSIWNSKIFVTTEHDNNITKFKELCRKFFEKRIYWLELRKGMVHWHLVYDSDFYISRMLNDKFYLHLDISEVIDGESYSDFFIFSNSSRKMLIDIFKKECDKSKVISVFKEQIACEKFEEMKNAGKTVHLIRVENETKKLIWVRSSGSIDNIRKYVVKNIDLINENTFANRSDKMVLFSGDPGIGKSTTVLSLAKKLKSTWVILKEMKKCHSLTHLSSKLNIDEVVTFLLDETESSSDEMTAVLLKACLTQKCALPVLLIFDGIEETIYGPTVNNSLNYRKSSLDKFFQLLEFLKEETTATIWITCRSFLTRSLENQFSIFGIEIEELREDEQKKFFSNIWTARLSTELKEFGHREENLLEKYIQLLVEEAESVLGSEKSTFMGAPLQLWMIAEVAAPDANIFSDCKDALLNQSAISLYIGNVYDLYQRFIKAKYDIYFQKTSGLSNGLTIATRNWLVKSFNRNCRYLAFQSLFPNEAEDFLGLKLVCLGNESLLHEEIELNRLGLIQSNFRGNFKFIHQTFAECFVAELLIIWLEKHNGRHPKYSPLEELLLRKVLLCPEYRIVRLFVNNILAVRKLRMDSLKFYARRIWMESFKEKELFLNERHQTALHVVSEENCENIVELLLNISNPKILGDIFPDSIDTSFLITSRDSFGNTAFKLACQQKHENVISIFIQFLNENSEFVQKEILLSTLYGNAEDQNDPHINYLLERISKDGSETLRELVANIVKCWELIPKFLEAAKRGDENLVKKILHECPDSITREFFVAVKDKSGKSALHFASEEGFQEVTEYLLSQKAPVNIVDETGCNPLLLAAKKGHTKIVRLLHSHGSNIFLNDAYNMSSVAWSAREGHLSVVEYLVREGVDINVSDRNGIDPVEHAAKSGHLEIVKWLMKYGANIHRSDRFGMTALSWASRAGHIDVVKHLVLCDADALTPDRNGITAAQHAAKNNKWDVAKWLLVHGLAQPGDLLHRAVCGNQWRVAEDLISLCPDGDASGWFAPEGTWLIRLKKAKKWKLMARLIAKGADPGMDSYKLLHELIEKHWMVKESKVWEENIFHGERANTSRMVMEHKSKEHKKFTEELNHMEKLQVGVKNDMLEEGIQKETSKEEGNMSTSIKNEFLVVNSEHIPGEEHNIGEQSFGDRGTKNETHNTESEGNGVRKLKAESTIVEQTRGEQGDANIREDEIINNDDLRRGNKSEGGGRKDTECGKRGVKGKSSTKECKGNIRSKEDDVTDTIKKDLGKDGKAEDFKKELERVIRLCDVHSLDSLIDTAHINYIFLEKTLAEVNQDFATKLIHLLPPMKEAVEERLIQFRLYSEEDSPINEKIENISLDDVKHCVETIERNVMKISIDYSEKEVDSVFLHIAISIARYIHVLKRFLKPTFSLLPWNEIEFCLVIFLSTVLKSQSSDEIYVLILNKTTVLNHLVIFSKKLLEVSSTLQKKDITSKGRLSGRIDSIKKIIAENPEFEKLYNDYDVVKNVYSLNRIHSYVKMAISVDLKEDSELGKVLIERTLQVLGECLKNTPDSPNVSDDVHRLLLKSAPRHAKDIITSLRDFLSHADALTRKIELESNKDSAFFVVVQNDLKKMGAEITCILFRKKIDTLKAFLEKILHCNSLEQIKKLSFRFENNPSTEKNYFPFKKMELEKIKEWHAELEIEYVGHSLKQDSLFKKIKGIIDSEESKIIQVIENYKHHLRRLSRTLKYFWNVKSVKARVMNLLEDMELNETKLVEILPMLEEFNTEIAKSTQHKRTSFNMMFTVLVENDRVPGIDEIKFRLSKNENKENDYIKKQIFESFNRIQNKLKSEKDKEEFAKMNRGKIKLHESKKRLIDYFNKKLRSKGNGEVDRIDCLPLFEHLNMEGKKKQDLETSYNESNFEKCRSLVNTVDDKYNNLMKNMGEISAFSVEKHVIALRAFFSTYKKLRPQINKALDEIEEENKLEVARFYYERITVLKNILENGKYGEEMMTAIEMLILEATEILEHASLLADNKFFLVEDSPVLVGKALRNYLAHGDPLIDIMPFSPRTSIIAHARALVSQGGDLIAQGRVLGRPSKPLDFLEVCSRDSRREMMAAVQEGMFQAAKKGDLAEVQEWMSKGADPQGRSINGKSALHFAIISDDVDTFQFFLGLDNFLDIRQTIVDAVSEGSINILKYVCDTHSLDLNTNYFKDANLLHCVSKSGKTAVLEFLLGHIENPDTLNQNGYHPLEYAVEEGHIEVVEMLLKHTKFLNDTQDYTDIVKTALIHGQSHIIPVILQHAFESNIKIDKKSTLLHYASLFGQEKAISVLLANGFSVNDKDEEGNTPLTQALRYGYEEFALVLLDRGAEIDTDFHDGMTLLHLAARHGQEKVIKVFLDKGFPVNVLNVNGWTALHSAAKNGHSGAVRVLLDSGADARVQSALEVLGKAGERGFTALHLAADIGSTEVVREIIEKDPETLNLRDADMHTPLHWAVRAGHVDVVAALVEAGAELNCANTEGVTPLHVSIFCGRREVSKMLIEKGANIGMKSNNGASTLMLACKVACIETVNALINKGADVIDDNMSGSTPLHVAAETGCEEVIAALLNAGARGDTQDAFGQTPLMKAIWCGHNNTRLVEMLLAKCPQAVNIPKENSQTPLRAAILNGHCDVVATLLRHGADVNLSYNKDLGCLSEAAFYGHKDVVELLLKHGLPVNGSGDGLDSPLHSAVSNDRREVVEILLDNGADVNFIRDGICALTYALLEGHEDMAILLVERGANVNVREDLPDAQHVTPLALALGKGFFRLSRALLLHGADMWDVHNGLSALHVAVGSLHCDVDMINFILDHEEERLRSTSQGDGLNQVQQGNKALVNYQDAKGSTPLHLSCIHGRADVCAVLMDRGADPTLVDNDGTTPLQVATVVCDAEVVLTLTGREGASVNVRNKKGRSALHLGCLAGRAEVVRALLNNGALVNAKDNYLMTPLHLAANSGHANIIGILIVKKAALNAQNEEGHTPLYMGCVEGHTDVVRTLLENGADVNIADNGMQTPTHMAAFKGHTEVITLLLGEEVHNASINAQDIEGRTPLHYACSHGHRDVVAALLDKWADSTVRDGEGRTSLFIAASNGYTDITSLIAGNQAESLNIEDKNGCSPLHMACSSGHTEVVKILLNKGALVNTCDNIRMTPLHTAAYKGHADIVRLLLDNEASPNAQQVLGHTPLFLACAEGHQDVVSVLLEKGADVNIADNGLQTATHMAAFRGHSAVVALLLGKGVFNTCINAKDIEGKSPLHYACMEGHTEVATVLLDTGADPNIKDYSSLTPLHLAANNGHTDIILLLMDKQVDVEPRDVNDWTPMFCAAHSGHPGAIQLLAAYGASVNATATQDITPLLVTSEGEAVPEVKSSTAQALLAAGADPNLPASNGLTPLWSAVIKADISLVSVLLQGGANVNVVDAQGATPYMVALSKSLNNRNEEVRKKYELIAGLLLSASE